MFKKTIALLSLALTWPLTGTAGEAADNFAQLGHLLDTATESRLASGAPGPQYWQQRADYHIEVTLDERARRIRGSETITYHNNSPHPLSYIWLQLDQNRFRRDSLDMLSATSPSFEQFPYSTMANLLARDEFAGGVEISSVRAQGKDLPYVINGTLMRIDLPTPISAQTSLEFEVSWQHNIVDATVIGARGGYEHFPEDGNDIYEIAQWYPRLTAYTDYEGWHNKQFMGRGEFTLELGDFTVEITVPADHVVAATGVLQNPDEVLSRKQRKRYEKAQGSDELVFVVTPEEAERNESSRTSVTKTWKFHAENVRDFAFASSRKFIWDAMSASNGGDGQVLAMSYYPNEAEPLWSQYSTKAIVHTIDSYSRYTFEYPYPVSISVNGPVGGMEYPMITFNKPRPYGDKTYWDVRQKAGDKTWERSKYGLISVIIHEVGHNYFPMIVNSDERQWTWMDEGLNTFLQFVAEQSWEENYPSRRGEPENIVEYMVSEPQVPIMTNSEAIYQFGNNAYGKPATALNILRESVMGRELFDFAFKEYARRWMFKRPTPADFFRTMEDASGTDLDWFWRGWFYGTGHVDVALTSVELYQIDSGDPEQEKAFAREQHEALEATLSQQRNAGQELLVERDGALKDFYNDYDEFAVTPWDYAQYEKLKKGLTDRERALLAADKNFYAVSFANLGGLVTPLPLRITYDDGEVEELQLPAQIWRRNHEAVTKLFITDREIVSIELDPYRATADADTANNSWPRKAKPTRFKLFKEKEQPNPMRRQEKEQWEQPIR
jgi:hypothetical protein